MLHVELESIHSHIKRIAPSIVAVICQRMKSWPEWEDGKEVWRHKVDGQADQFIATMAGSGISCIPIPDSAVAERRSELLSADICVIAGDPYYQLLSIGSKIRKFGYVGPIFLEITQQEAENSKIAEIAVKRSQLLGVVDLLKNFVYLTRIRRNPRSVDFHLGIESESEETNNYDVQSLSHSLACKEGGRYECRQTRIERNTKARQACIDHYGAVCAVCGFDFSVFYGPQIPQLIHVHHLKALAKSEGHRLVNPIEDLRPVCPNCHFVIHSKSEMYSLEDVRNMMTRARSSKGG